MIKGNICIIVELKRNGNTEQALAEAKYYLDLLRKNGQCAEAACVGINAKGTAIRARD